MDEKMSFFALFVLALMWSSFIVGFRIGKIDK
jgi:hypothetical protein